MQTYLAVVSREPIADDTVDRVEDLSRIFLPFTPHVQGQAVWCSPCGRVRLWAWDNGPDGWPSGIASTPRKSVTLSGYVLSDGKLAQPEDLLDRDFVSRGIEGLGGCFSVCLGEPERVRAWVPLVRLEHVYWTTNGTMTVVSNRALASHLVATGGTRPTYSRAFIRSLLAAGFPATDVTPFEGTSMLGPGGTLVATPRGVRASRSRWTREKTRDLDKGVGQVVEALRESVAFLPHVSSSLSSALTGGKDSRLISAALRAAEVPFTAVTGGLEEHPDVVIAARVAATLGVPHRRQSPGGEERQAKPNQVEHSVLGDACRRLFGSDGTHPAFEAIAFAKEPITSHSAGLTRLRAHALKHEKYLVERARSAEHKRVRQWFFRNAAWPEGSDTLWRYYAEFRAGRWAAAGWAAASIARPRVWPFFDARVVRAIRGVSSEDRISERSIVAALRRLAPELDDVPLAGDRWRFEKDGPVDGDHSRWIARSPLVVVSPRGRFDWRLHFSSGLGELMTELIAAHFDATDIVDSRQVHELLGMARDGRLDGRRPEGYFLWLVFSVAVLFSNEWLSPDPPPGRIRFPLPPSD